MTTYSSSRIRRSRDVLATCLALLLLASAEASARNIILFIGDGMGPEQVRAAGMLANGEPGTLSFEKLPYKATVMTSSATDLVTDSAAAGTALATGRRVANGVLSMAIPGDRAPLETILETCAGAGKATGLVTTTYLTHATPAAFGSHQSSRGSTDDIAWAYLTVSRPNVLLGGGANGMCPAAARLAEYTVVTNRDGLMGLDTESTERVCGLFGTDHLPYEYDGLGSHPHLSEMTRVALAVLDNDPEGFFLMVEGGRIDHACHDNDIYRALPEVIEFANAVQVGIEWAKDRDDTLILVTADHETGGLGIRRNLGAGRYPETRFTTGSHTATSVGLWAWGKTAERVSGTIANTEVHRIMAEFHAEVDAAAAAR